MNSKKKRLAALAVAMASLLSLTSTFAWQSISQQALNEAKNALVINPGGRLHDDFSGYKKENTKDVYVENFGDQEIYARIRLYQYMEIGQGAGIRGEEAKEKNKSVSLVEGALRDKPTTWTVHIPKADAVNVHDSAAAKTQYKTADKTFDTFWAWTMGGQDPTNREGKTIYMPTFNKDGDSLKADINGTMEGTTPGDNVYYDDFVSYALGQQVTGKARYDANPNSTTGNTEGTDYILREETHTAVETGTAVVMTMAEYEKRTDKATLQAWVYDTDGWAYWSQPIKPGKATGLLLDKIELKGQWSDWKEEWYYAINVVGQFITADDLGKTNHTGFYTSQAEAPSAAALQLLKSIGVNDEADAGTASTVIKNAENTPVTGTTVELAPGSNAVYTVNAVDNNGTEIKNGWNWLTSDPTVATVTPSETGVTVNVLADAAENATATITATNTTAEKATASFIVKVVKSGAGAVVTPVTYATDIKNAENASVKGNTVELVPGSSVVYTANITASDSSAVNGTWSWNSSDPAVAAVVGNDASATVTIPDSAVAQGTAIITASNSVDKNAVATLTVKVAAKTAAEKLSVGDKKVLDGKEYTVVALNSNLLGADNKHHNAALLLSTDVQAAKFYEGGSTGSNVPAYLTTEWAGSNPEAAAKIIPYSIRENNSGSTSTHKVFLLSREDVYGAETGSEWKYTNGERLPYFKDHSASANYRNRAVTWWLRPDADIEAGKIYVVNTSGDTVTVSRESNYGVRPAFWYNLES